MSHLESLAAETSGALRTVWDDLGVPPEERTAYLARIGEDVAALYVGRVAAQEQRRADMLAAVAALHAGLDAMQAALGEKVAVVRAARGARARGARVWERRGAERGAGSGRQRGWQ